MEKRFTKPCKKIAAFDLDHTLLKPASGAKFAKNKDDAELVFPEIEDKLNELMDDGYKIVIFSNQKALGGLIQLSDLYHKIDTFLPRGNTYDVYIASKSDTYRKPHTGLLDAFMDDNGAVTDIFYVGDAAGRKGDFSDSDRKFAHNCGIDFYTPEEFFLGAKFNIPPLQLVNKPQEMLPDIQIPVRTVVIMVGPPGCGKSTLSSELCERYPNTTVLSNDVLGNATKTLGQLKKDLKRGVSRIIIDNTNGKTIIRKRISKAARDFGYSVTIISFHVFRDVAEHMNHYRAHKGDKEIIPNVAYNMYYKHFQAVNVEDDYDKIWYYVPDYPREAFELHFKECKSKS